MLVVLVMLVLLVVLVMLVLLGVLVMLVVFVLLGGRADLSLWGKIALKFSGDALYSHLIIFLIIFYFFNLTSFTGYFSVIFESRKAFFIF